GGVLLCGASTPWVGLTVFAVSTVLLIVWPYVILYRTVVDRTRGLPEPQPCSGPRLLVEQAAWLAEATDGPGGLFDLGFQPAGWFFLDDMDQIYVWAWPHRGEPTVAYIQYLSGASTFRFRFVTRLPGGGAIISTTRLTDI